MKTSKYIVVNGNQAVARIAYKTNEICPIYPITPASEMSELVEQWSAEQRENIFGNVPAAFEMQSEGGVAGTMHGALQTGSLSTTFTASQGLLLMLPNMYKIAGELSPNVIHVATRSIATHALSIFGDHSDIMAVRSSGYAILGGASVQEAQDFALIAQAATLASRIPFIHYFDGFRTSHEISKIQVIPDKVISSMIDLNLVQDFRDRALDPNNPVIRGTSQGADVFFQSREATNTYYQACADTVQNTMDHFAALTGRQYRIFDYVGHPEARQLIVSMASSCDTIERSIQQLNQQGQRIGLIKVRLFRPFSTKHLLDSLPKSVRSIAVIDRTKEPGATGEPLLLDIVQGITQAYREHKIEILPEIIGGRYGLSSKEFTPSMVRSIVDNLKESDPKGNFTIGINDDVTHLSLPISDEIDTDASIYEAIFYETKSDISNQSIYDTARLIGNTTTNFIQAYAECDYKKTGSRFVSHMRIAPYPITCPYLISQADMIVCDHIDFMRNDNVLDSLKPSGTLLVNSSLKENAFWTSLSGKMQRTISKNSISLFLVNTDDLNPVYMLRGYGISNLQACFFALKHEVLNDDQILEILPKMTKVTTLDTIIKLENSDDLSFSDDLLDKMLLNQGHEAPVSLLPADGSYPTDTSKFNVTRNEGEIPQWQPDLCVQCGACSMACPQGAIRIKAYEDKYLPAESQGFKSVDSIDFDLMNYTVQVHPEQCNSCHNCIDACEFKALAMTKDLKIRIQESDNWKHFDSIPEFDRRLISPTILSQQQLQEPLFKYGSGETGCGEAPYLKLLSQLFGDRMVIANATGASSIFGGSLPTTPWSKNKDGKGPAWSNSLFEDNAEFGLGFRLSLDQQQQRAKEMLSKMTGQLDDKLVASIIGSNQDTEASILEQKERVMHLKQCLEASDPAESGLLLKIAESLIRKSVWCVGGDGWAYDIGYGGIDHVLASGQNVNILVLDNEVYDNTGGQASKATPFGASAKFKYGGKKNQKKDLGALAMTYDNVYVASVAMGADREQTLKAFVEAESFNGPSLIIAYCHSKSHGIDMKNPSKYHQAAVDSGQWPLYRNDPRRRHHQLATFQLDSLEPSINIVEYLKLEGRFSKLLKDSSYPFESQLSDYQTQINKRFDRLLQRSLDHSAIGLSDVKAN